MLMAVAARRRSALARPERTRLYRIVEVVGRWSMLDVFVVSLLAGLVKVDNVAEITAGPGIAAFGAVVVLTMLASISFDPRIAWDAGRVQAAPMGPAAAGAGTVAAPRRGPPRLAENADGH